MKHPHLNHAQPRQGVDHGGMTDAELIRRAEAAGISTTYENWQHKQVAVPPQTLKAILAALAQANSAATAVGGGVGRAPGAADSTEGSMRHVADEVDRADVAGGANRADAAGADVTDG